MTKNDRMPRLGRRLFLIAGSSLALAACGTHKLVGPPDAPQIYVLRPTCPRAGGRKSFLGAGDRQARCVEQPGQFERIALSKSETQLDYYANATWPDRLPDLVQTSLLAGFEAPAASMRCRGTKMPCIPITNCRHRPARFRGALCHAGRHPHRGGDDHRPYGRIPIRA